MDVKRVFLVGYMGCGKSTLGRWLSSDLKWRFLDMDDFIEKKQGRTISQIFEDEGEAAFRKMEQDAITELSQEENVIIATGGGAPCFFDNVEKMNAAGLSIYMKLTPQTIFNRVKGATKTRPLLASLSESELLAFITEKLEEREPFYMKCNVIADAESLDVEGFVNIIKSAQ